MIKDSEAVRYIGKNVEVRGLVVSVTTSPLGTACISFGREHPDQTFAGFIAVGSKMETDQRIGTLPGKIIGITGIIELYRGKPEIKVTSTDQIKGLDSQAVTVSQKNLRYWSKGCLNPLMHGRKDQKNANESGNIVSGGLDEQALTRDLKRVVEESDLSIPKIASEMGVFSATLCGSQEPLSRLVRGCLRLKVFLNGATEIFPGRSCCTLPKLTNLLLLIPGAVDTDEQRQRKNPLVGTLSRTIFLMLAQKMCENVKTELPALPPIPATSHQEDFPCRPDDRGR